MADGPRSSLFRLPHMFLSCLARNEAVLSKGWNRETDWGGDRLSDTGVRLVTPCVRLDLCCDSARLRCAPLCTTMKPASGVVILLCFSRLMRNKPSCCWNYSIVGETKSYMIATKKKLTCRTHGWDGPLLLSFKACHCCSIIVHRGVCDCWIMALCILVWLHHQTEWVCALSPSSHEFLCGNRQLWWG